MHLVPLPALLLILLFPGCSGMKQAYPLLTPHRIDLVINQRAAREMGIDVPHSVLDGATRIIK